MVCSIQEVRSCILIKYKQHKNYIKMKGVAND
jgi:hypothetical protein